MVADRSLPDVYNDDTYPLHRSESKLTASKSMKGGPMSSASQSHEQQRNQSPPLSLQYLVLDAVQAVLLEPPLTQTEVCVSVRAGFLLLVGQHGVASHLAGVARHVETVMSDAVKQVVVLAAPTPELVTEPVDGGVLLRRHGRHASKTVLIQ